MEQNKYIGKKLIEKNIHQYKIIQTKEKGLFYKDVFRKVSCDIIISDRILVLFKTNKGISKFTVSACESKDKIDSLIETCIENTSDMGMKWHNDNFQDSQIEHNGTCENFHNFNVNDYLTWFKQELHKVRNGINLELNAVYKISNYKYSLLTNENYLEQYHMSSECICMENRTFQKRSMLCNKFLKDDLSNIIIEQLNKESPPFKQLELDKQKQILIKAKALASILNIYINCFYADSVYLKQSFIKTSDIGKQIVKSPFDLISLVYNGLQFDAEGSKIAEKQIITKGKLVNLLSNNSMSSYLNLKSYGNASYNNIDAISHQRLKFMMKDEEKCDSKKSNIVIHQFENIYLDFKDKTFQGMAICSDGSGIYNSAISFSVEDIFDNMCAIDDKRYWIENIYCQDIMILK